MLLGGAFGHLAPLPGMDGQKEEVVRPAVEASLEGRARAWIEAARDQVPILPVARRDGAGNGDGVVDRDPDRTDRLSEFRAVGAVVRRREADAGLEAGMVAVPIR